MVLNFAQGVGRYGKRMVQVLKALILAEGIVENRGEKRFEDKERADSFNKNRLLLYEWGM